MQNNIHNKIICAIDTPDIERAKTLTGLLTNHVGMIKLGLEFFTANGNAGVKEIQKTGLPIFLDLKFHDIPNTVAAAVREAAKLDIKMLTIHASGGKEMMSAAAEEIHKMSGNKPLLLGVTVLTSMGDSDLAEIGVSRDSKSQVLKLAKLIKESGLDGIVCSPHEIEEIRKEFGNTLKLVVPGVRPAWANNNDQKRVMTPAKAISKGADYIVVGRPITEADDPVETVRKIVVEL